jgi:hypothetical protein
MPWCSADKDCPRPDDWVDQICFAGYGYILAFHPECCPGRFDGSECFRDHPPKETDARTQHA